MIRLGVFQRDPNLHFNCETRGPRTPYFSGPTRGRQEKYLAFADDVGVVEIGVGFEYAEPGCAVTQLGLCDGPQPVAVAALKWLTRAGASRSDLALQNRTDDGGQRPKKYYIPKDRSGSPQLFSREGGPRETVSA